MNNNNWKKVFAIIWTGQFFSYLSSSVVGFAAVLWLSFETKSAEILAMAAIASMLPQALIGPFTGVLIDRWDRKKVMILSDLFVALCSLILGVLAFTGNLNVAGIYLLLALRSVGSAFHGPSMQASIPLLAPEDKLTQIAGFNQMILSVSSIAGPALGALMMTYLNIAYVMLFDVLGAVVACASLLFVHIPRVDRKDRLENPHVLREMRDGFRAISGNRGLLWMFGFSVIVMLFLMPVAVLFPLMTLEHFKGTAFQMSIIEVVWGIGMVLGGVFLGTVKLKVNEVVLINVSYLLLGLSFLFSGVLPQGGFVFFVILTTLGGIAGSLYHSLFTATVQRNVAPDALGRVFSLYGSVAVLPSLIGLTATGFIADNIGIDYSFIYSGIVITLLGVVAMFVKSMLRLGTNRSGAVAMEDGDAGDGTVGEG
jgi:DHA3 family macrolide efflux protein-like MFS transporter